MQRISTTSACIDACLGRKLSLPLKVIGYYGLLPILSPIILSIYGTVFVAHASSRAGQYLELTAITIV